MIINWGARLQGKVNTSAVSLKGSAETSGFTISGKLICGAGQVDTPSYAGPYVVTPTRETQILPTINKLATNDITVNPIPSNYGLITWNGTVLTVS